MIPRDLFFASFDQIWNLLWILFFVFIIFYAAYRRRRSQVISYALQPAVVFKRDPILSALRYCTFFLAWVLAVLALMDPLGNETYPKAFQEKVRETKAPLELFFLIDVSQSMGVQDVRTSRLKKAVEIADALAKKLPSDPIALYAFTSKALPIVPLTYNGVFVRLMLRELVLNEGDTQGTLIGNALIALKNDGLSEYPKAPKAVILFSDGGDNLAEESPNGKNTIFKAASELKVPIFTVGIGSAEGGVIPDVLQGGKQVTSHLEEALLKGIAEASGGKYFTVSEFSSQEIASNIAQGLKPFRLKASSAGLLQFSKSSYKPYFQAPLGIAIGLLLVFAFLAYGKKGLGLFPFMVFSSLYSQNTGENLYDAGKYQEAVDWYLGELKNLPVPWLRDKLFYNLGVAFAAKEEGEEATNSFFMVSKDAYSYPLFQLRLVYSRLLALLELAIKEKRPELLQEGLLMLQILDPPKDSPLNQVKTAFQMELGKMADEPSKDELSSLIRTIQFAASLSLVNLTMLKVMLADVDENDLWKTVSSLISRKIKEADDPTVFLETIIKSLILDPPAQNAAQFYPLVNKWQKLQFEKGICQCEPWKEVLPLFTEGLKMQQAPPSHSKIPYTYSKWREALALLKHPPSGGKSQEEAKESKEELQELQGMQDLDRQFQKPPQLKKGEGMKW